MIFFPDTVRAKGMALLLAMLFSFTAAQAQDTLKEVRVKARRNRQVSNDERINTFSPGQKITTIDSLTLQQYQFQSMASLLSQQVPVFVKSYGINGLATLNFRGASSAQSQVYWNGVPIQNAALGMADVSLLPVGLMNKVNVVYGSSSALWGSGNVGGALLVENDRPAFDSNGKAVHSVSGVAGSFGQYQLGLRSSLALKRWVFSVNAFGQTAKNDFRYDDNYGAEKRMPNSQMQSGTVLLQGGYKVDEHNTIGLTAWYQQYYREIPPATFESSSVKNQRDESLRLLFDWDRKTGKGNVYAKASYIRDYMRYRDDSLSDLNSKNITHQVYSEVGVKYKFNAQHELLLFAPINIAWIDQSSDNTADTIHAQQIRIALAAAYAVNFFDNRLKTAVTARGEAINDKLVFLPGLSASFAILNWLSVKANVQRSYRAPTLNELYFVPGGNDKLKPEQGWNIDGGYTIKTPEAKKLVFYHDLSLFDRRIHDWIIWFGGAIWTPHNIAIVHSRGVETENKLNWHINSNWLLHIGLNTSYVIATTEESHQPYDGSIGKQIPYSPRYSGQANIGFGYKGLFFNYNHTYTGYRFITVDESQYLEPYNIGNVQLLYTVYIDQMPLQLTAQCNNLWNQEYAVVAGRPMPGINFLLGLRFTLL